MIKITTQTTTYKDAAWYYPSPKGAANTLQDTWPFGREYKSMIAKTTTTTPLAKMLAHARAATDALFGMVRPGAFHDRPVPERHRTIFYLGQLEAFDWNLLSQAAGVPSFHPEFDQLFAFGIDSEPGQLPQDTRSDWAGSTEVQRYNLRVRKALDVLSNRVSEQVLCVAPTRAWPISVGWDNEFDGHEVSISVFAMSKYKVTNGEYLEFVRAGGKPPHFWTWREGQWWWRAMSAAVPLPMDWPVYVTHHRRRAPLQPGPEARRGVRKVLWLGYRGIDMLPHGSDTEEKD